MHSKDLSNSKSHKSSKKSEIYLGTLQQINQLSGQMQELSSVSLKVAQELEKLIIEDHGGSLWLDSSCPYTRFVIDLPHQKFKRNQKNYE